MKWIICKNKTINFNYNNSPIFNYIQCNEESCVKVVIIIIYQSLVINYLWLYIFYMKANDIDNYNECGTDLNTIDIYKISDN